MAKATIYDVLADNVRAGMVEKYGKENQTKLVGESGIGPGTISRILGTEEQPRGTSIGVEVLEKIAGPLSVPPWLLLFPRAQRIFHKKNLQNFLKICEAWAAADENGERVLLTAALLAVRDVTERGETAVSTDRG